MSLIGALNIGQSGIAVAQAQIQTTGNNIANAGNADYARQVAGTTPAPGQELQPGLYIGNGVDLSGIQRQIDEALQNRLRASVSDNAAADTTQQWLSRIETTFNGLGDQSLSKQMGAFFNNWSNLANKPQDLGLRQVVLQSGDSLAQSFRDLRAQLGGISTDAGKQLTALTTQADALSNQIAELNGQIAASTGNSAGAVGSNNSLLDQRDADLKQLSQLLDIKTVDQPNGVVNVYVGSEPLVLNAASRGIALKQATVNGTTTRGLVVIQPVFKSNNGTLNVNGGKIGGLVDAQQQINSAVDKVDTLAGGLIFELNKLHSSGQGLSGFGQATATNAVTDATVPLDDPKSGLKFAPNNGSFVVHVMQKSTGLTTSSLIRVNLGAASGNTTLNALAASLASVGGINVSTTGRKLSITAASPDAQISFSQDSSGTLAVLGVNTFYTGNDARSIALNPAIADQPTLLAAAQNGDSGDNQTARAIAALGDKAAASFGGSSLNSSYENLITGVGTASANAKTNADATKSVTDTLQAQRDSLSGVSLDEEAINLVRQQRAFQASARLISAVDEMMKTLLSM